MATIETALQLFSNAYEKLSRISEAASRTSTVIEAIPSEVDIGTSNVIDRFNEMNDILVGISEAASKTSAVVEAIPSEVDIGTSSGIDRFNEMNDILNGVSEAASRTSTVVEAIPPEVVIGVGDSISQFNEINDMINSVVERFSELRENASFIEFNEVEKLEIMKRELDNNQSRLNLMTDVLDRAKQKWIDMAAASGKNSGEALKLQAEYLKVDKQVNTLEKSNYRVLDQINKQVNKLESLKIPTESFDTGKEKLQAITNEIEAQSQKIDEQVQKVDEQAQKFNRVGKAVEDAKSKQDQFKSKIEESTQSADKLNNKIMGYVKSFIGIAAIKKGIENTIGSAAELSGQFQVMQGMFGNADVGAAFFNQLQDYALKTGRSIDALTNTTHQFLSVTRNTDKLMGLNNVVEKLNIKNPTQSYDTASSSVVEALNGRYTSLQRSFHLSDAQLAPIKEAVAKGNLEGIIEAFDRGLNMAGITDEVVNAYRNTVPSQIDTIKNKMQTGFAQAGISSLKMLELVLQRINAWLDSEKATTFFNNITMGVNFATIMLTSTCDFIVSNWDLIKVVLMGVGIVLGIMAVQAIAAKAQFIALGSSAMTSALSTAAAWAVANWPLTLMITLVGMLIAAYIKAGGQIENVLGVIGGTFSILWAFIHNGIATTWNMFISFAEFLGNLFIDPVYAIKKLFYDLALDVLGFFQNLFNGIANGLNQIIERVNSLPGINIKLLEGKFLNETIAKIEANAPTTDKNVYDLSGMKVELKDYGQSWNSGFEKGYNMLGQITDIFEGFDSKMTDLNAFNSLQVDSLGSIGDTTGKIKDSLDIAEEELKYFRDIAEREAINKIITNTIVPQLKVNFGDVRETADIDQIIGRITEMVKNELAVCAEGVHE